MSDSRFSIDGSAAIVTGASSGIGKAIAERFAADGLDVVICSREQDNVEPVAESITESERPGSALGVECDVTDRDAVDALVETSVEEFGGLDVLVNNAGASFMANFDDISPNGWATIVNINLTGTYHCTQAAGEYLKDGGGSVINLSSEAGQDGAPYMSHYAAAKAAVINLTTTLGNEWASENVRVNCIAPGYVATPGVESQMGVTAEEIADVAQFLASPAASYIVGETIRAAGTPDILKTPNQ